MNLEKEGGLSPTAVREEQKNSNELIIELENMGDYELALPFQNENLSPMKGLDGLRGSNSIYFDEPRPEEPEDLMLSNSFQFHSIITHKLQGRN
jgi:hypothetical protein